MHSRVAPLYLRKGGSVSISWRGGRQYVLLNYQVYTFAVVRLLFCFCCGMSWALFVYRKKGVCLFVCSLTIVCCFIIFLLDGGEKSEMLGAQF